ncbi:hypothetical protein HYPSUDRAFT_51140 [Hypholoma sublateritium FD-334 SS-4]|uniref:Uncharacterized protein n=1 Tax=Hypholoma sublateritium (strain FD-334 SS-4) TaxID=945553 RepID=A0A0D2Q9E0_HYPSF|nr:hypothetical protein HYPSUDRAFT_51140 [Hypholoma sublateritium FD-334 SS-4]
MDAREAMTLRRSIVLTEIGFHLEEIRTKLRIYDGDAETLAAISSKITETEALAQNQRSLLDFPALLRHQTSSRHGQPSFSQRNRPFLCQMQPILNETRYLRQEANVVFYPVFYVSVCRTFIVTAANDLKNPQVRGPRVKISWTYKSVSVK